MISPGQVIDSARKWLHTPYQHQGRVINVACDCIGLVYGVCTDLGIPHELVSDYPRIPDGTMLQSTIQKYCSPLASPTLGALLLFRIRENPQHVAIATEKGMIHAHAGSDFVCEHELDQKWRARIVGIYALPGVDYG